jgi:transcription initiation factor TFIIE subunit alpha
MKIPSKLIEEVASRVAGEDVIPIVRALMGKRDVSEFKLATETKTEINLVRNMLYRLYNANLVTSIKKKDKKKGWYIYYWTLNLPRFNYLAKDLMQTKLAQLKERLAREKSSHFYMCGRNCIRLNFEQATDFEFKCPECGDLLHQDDNRKKIIELEKDIKKLEKSVKKKLPPMPVMKEKEEKPPKKAKKAKKKKAGAKKKKPSKKVKKPKAKKKKSAKKVKKKPVKKKTKKTKKKKK